MRFVLALSLLFGSILVIGIGASYLDNLWRPVGIEYKVRPIAALLVGLGGFYVSYRLLLWSDQPPGGRGDTEQR